MSGLADLFVSATWFFWLPNMNFHLPPESFSIAAIFSGAGATILGKFTSQIGLFTLSINYLALLAGALLGNWFLADAGLPLDPRLTAPILFACVGMVVAGVSMMMILRKS